MDKIDQNPADGIEEEVTDLLAQRNEHIIVGSMLSMLELLPEGASLDNYTIKLGRIPEDAGGGIAITFIPMEPTEEIKLH